MPRTLSRPLLTAVIAPVVGILAIAALSGCTPTAKPSAGASGSSSASPSQGASTSASASAAPTPTATPTPVALPCSSLITADEIYAFNPNFSLLSSWTPPTGSDAATAKADQGIACRWQNETSGDTIDVSVAHLDAASIEALKNAAVEKSTMVPTYGDEAYFSATGGVGTAIVFQGNYWMVASSVDFAEPGDPADLITAALTRLK